MKAAGPIGVMIIKPAAVVVGLARFSRLAENDMVVRRSTTLSPSLSWEKVVDTTFPAVGLGNIAVSFLVSPSLEARSHPEVS